MELPFSFPFINGRLSDKKQQQESKERMDRRQFSAWTYLCLLCFAFVFGMFAATGVFVFVFAITGVFAPAIPRVIPLDQLE